jgi:uncharacterized protein DUF2604
MANQEQKLTITVVVSGQPTSVTVNVHQRIEHLVKDALHNTGNQGQPPADWELRTSDGVLIEQTLTIEAASIVTGMTLYLSPRAGAGGSA